MLNLLALTKSLLPALLIVADVFRYGIKKYGSDTWKNDSAQYHVEQAMAKLGEWVTSPTQYTLLADAGLRLLFALFKTKDEN